MPFPPYRCPISASSGTPWSVPYSPAACCLVSLPRFLSCCAFGGDSVITGLAESSGLGAWGILAALMAEIFLLGFSFDWIEITLIVLRIFVPIVELLDFDGHVSKAEVLYWLAILMAINLQTSFLTPPFGFTLFYVKGAAPSVVSMQEIWRGSMPFVGLQRIALALVMALPDIALWLPRTYLN